MNGCRPETQNQFTDLDRKNKCDTVLAWATIDKKDSLEHDYN